MGRPRDSREKHVIHVVLTLHQGEDDDLIELYQRTPPRQRSKATISAMRAGGLEATKDQIDIGDEEMVTAADDFLV